MSGTQAALLLLAVTGLACGLLVAFVVERKLRRDRREWISGYGRERLRTALLAGDQEVIRMAAVRARDSQGAQVDFAVAASGVVDQLDEDGQAALESAVRSVELPSALVEQLGDRDPEARGRAVLLLGELRIWEAAKALPDLLTDGDPDVRLVACAELSGLATDDAAYSLIAALMAASLPAERIIERLGRAWAVPAILSALKDDGLAASLAPDDGELSPKWRPALARALGVAADPRAEETLIELLESDSTEERVAAARALAASGTGRAVGPLIEALADPAWEVRAQAARSLAARPEQRAVPALEGCLSDDAWWVRANSADALATIGGPGIDALKRALSHADRYARERAREVLALHKIVEA